MSTPAAEPTREAASAGRIILAVATFEGRNRVRVTGVIAVLFALYGAMFLWLGPQLVAGDAMQDLLDTLPPVLIELFGFESLASMEGLLASEFYTFGWIVGLGGYLAYSAAGAVAGDLREQRMDTVLAAPVSRPSVLFGKYLALLVPILGLNVVVPVVLYAGSVLVGTPLAIGDIAILHALSIPLLLLWGALGLLLGVVIRGGRRAGRLALGLVFAAWMFDSFIGVSDFEWAGAITPLWYFDPPGVLVHQRYDTLGALVLFVAAVVLVCAALGWFSRRDL